MKLASPRYAAVIECDPAVRDEVVKVAWPLMSTLLDPRTVAPSWKLTVPVGVAAAALLMVAVNVIDCPTPDGLAEETSVMVVVAFVID